jgi:acetylornithine deacetylase
MASRDELVRVGAGRVAIAREQLAEALAEMVRIPSVNPDLVPGASGERAQAEAIAERLQRTPGIEVKRQDAGDGRPNVIASCGRGAGRTLLLNGHIDTVGVAGMHDPYDPRIEGNRLYGRGSYDMKGSMAGALVLLEELARANEPAGRVVVTFVVDEEYASIGTQAVCRELERWRPDAAIVLENSALDICVAHKGFAWAEIVARGKAAHGSRYWLGVDAIANMGAVLVGLKQLNAELLAREPHRYLGAPSLHASLIEGGQELSSYPETCRVQLERRTVPGETAEQIRAELQAVLDAVATADASFVADLSLGLVRDPFEVSEDAEIVQTLLAATRLERDDEPAFIGKAGWADSALLAAAGVPTVYFGPDGAGAHATEEWVDLDSLVAYTRVLARVVNDFCGASA